MKLLQINVPTFECIERKEDGFAYRSKSKGLVVIQSLAKEQDGNYWIHTSYSRRSRVPDYNDTLFIKNHFVGEDTKAIMVFPRKTEHVNFHPFCLHLYECCEKDPLPDFTRGTKSI